MRALRSLLGLLAAASLVACSSLNQGTLDGGARDAPSEAALDGGDVPDAPAAAIDVVDAPTIDAADVPTVDVPAPDIPAADVPAVDVPAADVPTVDVPTVDVPTVDVPTVDVVDASDVRDAGRCAAGALLCSGICVPDPMSDPRHCGRCGNACVLQHVAVHACSAGLCRVGTCAAGFADCDAVPGNGCETAVDTEVSCGACGNACPARAHASPRCRAGACGVACDVGFGDCDADPSNGCEVTFDSDPAHCGVCSSTCGGGTGCGDGACVNIPTPRLIAPLSTSTVTTRSPTLRWRNLPGATGAVVHVATSPNFSGEVTVAVASGSSARVGPLAPGTWYWYAQGVSRVSTNTGFQNTPVWQFVVGQGSAAVDRSFGTVSDFNRDGYGDFVVAAPDASTDYTTAPPSSGRVRLYLARSTGVAITSPQLQGGGPETSRVSTRRYGAAVASAGDTNGDGFPDLMVSGSDDAGGRVFVHHGIGTGVASTPARTLAVGAGAVEFGRSISSAGDVDGDGFGDVIVGATGQAYVFRGSAAGLVTTSAATLVGPVGDDFGRAVSSAGDVNGDGYGDVLVGAPAWGAGTGRFYLYLGSAEGIIVYPADTVAGPTGSRSGWSLASAGDTNGDGYGDVVVGAPDATPRGAIALYLGGPSGLQGSTPVTFSMGSDLGRFGVAVAGVGDVDGDGYGDVVVGAQGAAATPGAAYLLRSGGVPSLGGAPVTLAPEATDLGSGARFGAAVSGIGDANRDGFMDLLVGAPCAPSPVACGSGRVFYFRGGAAPSPTPVEVFSAPDAAGAGYGGALARRSPTPPWWPAI